MVIGDECMDQKTQTVINEIKYWKNNKLLPDHYCDFLITLYTEGSENSIKSRKLGKFTYLFYMLAILVSVALIGFLVLYFSDFLKQMQISLRLFLIVLFSIVMLAGIIFRIFFLQCLGLFSVIIMVAWSSYPYFEANFSWLFLEASWITTALVLFLVSRATRTINRKLSLNLYLNGLVLLFVPSMQALYIASASVDILQFILFTKVIIVSIFLYIKREKLVGFIKNSFE
jgi:hypothetical protein